MKRVLIAMIVVVSGFLAIHGYAQENITRFDKDFVIKIPLQFPTFVVAFERPGNDLVDLTVNTHTGLEYWPDSPIRMGVSLSYKEFGFQYVAKVGNINDDQIDSDVKTSCQDIQLFYYGSGLNADLYFQYYKGFYLEYPEDHVSGWTTGMKYPSRNDLSTLFIGANFYYTFSPESFSFNAAFNQTERQDNSGGSFLLMLSPAYYQIRADSSLILSNEESVYKNDAGFKSGDFFSMGIGPGVAYTFALGEDVFLSLVYFMTTGLQYQNYENASGTQKGWKPIYGNNIRIALGRNMDESFYGMNLIADGKASFMEDSAIMFVSMLIELYAGWRF